LINKVFTVYSINRKKDINSETNTIYIK